MIKRTETTQVSHLGIFLITLSVLGFTKYKNIKQATPQARLTSRQIYLPQLNIISE